MKKFVYAVLIIFFLKTGFCSVKSIEEAIKKYGDYNSEKVGGSVYKVDLDGFSYLLNNAYWIWWDKDTNSIEEPYKSSTFTFIKKYYIEGKIKKAIICVTAESSYSLFINDREVGKSDIWYNLEKYEIKDYIKPGENTFLIKAKTNQWFAGLFVAGIIETDKEKIEIISDDNWDCYSEVDNKIKKAECVVRGINGGWWNNANRLMVMPERFYKLNTELNIPKIEWLKPSNKKIKVLVIQPTNTQIDTIELIQRTDFVIKVVFTDIIKGKERAPFFPDVKGKTKDEVKEDIKKAIAENYDIVILGDVDKEIFGEVIAERLKKLIENGTGLIYTRLPFGYEEYEKQLLSQQIKEKISFLTTGIPFSALPCFNSTDDYSKVLYLYNYGKGKIAKFRNWGLLLNVNDPNPLNYEYYFSFFIKLILWMSGNEPDTRFVDLQNEITFDNTENPLIKFKINGKGNYNLNFELRTAERLFKIPEIPYPSPDLEEIKDIISPIYSKSMRISGNKIVDFKLPLLSSGKYFLDIRLDNNKKERINWATIALNIIPKIGISEISSEPEVVDISRGKPGNLKLNIFYNRELPEKGKLKLSIFDNYNRLIEEKIKDVSKGINFTEEYFKIPEDFKTRLGRIRAELILNLDKKEIKDIKVKRFTTIRKDWDRFNFIAYGGPGEKTRRDIIHGIIMKSLGVDGLRYSIPSLDFIEYVDWIGIPYCPGFTREKIEINKEQIEKLKEETNKILEKAVLSDPLAYVKDDEIYYGGGEELPGRIEFFRDFLKSKYKDINSLNKQWDTSYSSFKEIFPIVKKKTDERFISEEDYLKEAGKTRNYSRIVDQWLCNIESWHFYPEISRQIIKEKDPDARIGTGCPMWPHSFSGHDWYIFLKKFNLFAPYGREGEILPYEEARSFAKPDTLLGMYYGGYLYNAFIRREELCDLEWQYWRVWTALLRGFSSIWWYNMGVGSLESGISPGLLPYPSLELLSDQIKLIRKGYDKIFDRNKNKRNYGPIAVHYSIPSRLITPYLCAFGGGYSHNWDVHFLHRVLNDHLGFQYTFISDEQIQNGELGKYKVFIMPMSFCVNKNVSKKIKEFVEKGGIVIADVRPCVFDENGKWQEGNTEDIFGIRFKKEFGRKLLTGEIKGEYNGMIIENKKQKIPIDPSIEITKAKYITEIDGIPLITYNKIGSGYAICLNIPFNYYKGYATPDHLYYYIGEPEHNRLIGKILYTIFKTHNIKRPVDIIFSEEKGVERTELPYKTDYWIPGLEVSYHIDGEIYYIGITKRRIHKEEKPHKIIIILPKKGYIYDTLSEKYIGENERIETNISPGGVKIFSVFPYKVENIEILSEKKEFKPGEYGKFKVMVKTNKGKNIGRHVVSAEVIRPDGREVEYFAQRKETKKGKTDFEFYFSKNEMKGNWKIIFTDIATGIKKVISLRLK